MLRVEPSWIMELSPSKVQPRLEAAPYMRQQHLEMKAYMAICLDEVRKPGVLRFLTTSPAEAATRYKKCSDSHQGERCERYVKHMFLETLKQSSWTIAKKGAVIESYRNQIITSTMSNCFSKSVWGCLGSVITCIICVCTFFVTSHLLTNYTETLEYTRENLLNKQITQYERSKQPIYF